MAREARLSPRVPNAELPMKGLYALQWRVMAFTFAVPVLLFLLPWPQPLRLLAYALPPMALGFGLAVIFTLRCPACSKPLMARGLTISPRRRCLHCREVVA
jgi:hypothetical protein